mgnify:CR=1 FL=1
MKLVFASNNAHKLREVRGILPSDIEVIGLQDIGFVEDIAETGATLEENSAIKAHAVWQWLQEHPSAQTEGVNGVFADDTGLEITALHGAPGVHTARWAGEPANDANNRRKTLHELEGVAQREARFRTVVTLIRDGEMQQVEGIVNGKIASAESGNGGFGYDPLFIPEGHEQTFACLTEEQKNSISHRGRAMQALCELLGNGKK